MFRTWILPLVLGVLPWGCNLGVADRNEEAHAASALFQEFETVFFSTTELLSDARPHRSISRQDLNGLQIPFADLVGSIGALGEEVPAELLDETKSVLVGAKEFRPPVSLGSVQSRFCYVLIRRQKSELDLFRRLLGRPTSYAGMQIWSWQVKPSEGRPRGTSMYAVVCSEPYILISNDKEELEIIAHALNTFGEHPPKLEAIRDWKSVHQHSLWGYRRYGLRGQNDLAAGVSNVPRAAEALIFTLDIKKTGCELQIVGSGVNTASLHIMTTKEKLPPLEPMVAGLWRAAIPLTGDEHSLGRLLAIMGLFGFGVYL